MIHDYTKFEHEGLTVEVNWNSHVTPCKFIKFNIEGKEVIINREDFYAMMVLFADDKQMDDLIPVISTQVRAIRRMLSVRTKKDFKKGEVMTFPFTYYVPAATYEKLLLNNPKQYQSAELSPDLSTIVNKTK